MMKRSSFLYRCAAGFLMGLGCVLPGVSGGVMAVSFGLYRPMLDALTGLFHQFRRSFFFLLPLGFGGLAGVLLGAQGLAYVMARYETPMLYLFIGLILGSIPDLLREADSGRGFRKRYLWALLLGIGLALPMLLIPTGGPSAIELTPVQCVLCGCIYAFGTVVPGISSSFLLIYLGWYQPTLALFGSLAFPGLGWFGLGFVLTAAATVKAVQWLFDHAQSYAYYGVLGFVLVSVGLVFPGFRQGGGPVLDLLMLLLGLLGASGMSRLAKSGRLR